MTKHIVNNIFSVGILNPSLRVFDIVMKTDYGTSYNSYIVKGSEKTALIETAHFDFCDAYLDNIKEVVNIEDIDYLVMNHNEPDHSGSIETILNINPNITIVSSQAGAIYLKNITNIPNLNVKAVKDGEELNLGDKTLKFINAPFLHWPDSMFTYSVTDKVLFPCDFLGTHFCEPTMYDTNMHYEKQFLVSIKNYYDAIFSPFKPFVLKGLEKIKDLEIEFACPSHGPILTKNGLLNYVKENYYNWSKPLEHDIKNIPIFYCSAYDNTKKLANAIAVGIKEKLPAANVECFDIIENDMEDLIQKLNDADAFLIGSPTINKDALAPIWNLLSHVDAINIAKKPVALFGSYGWSGEAVPNLECRLNSLKVKLFEKSFRVVFVPTENDLKQAELFGEEFANQI